MTTPPDTCPDCGREMHSGMPLCVRCSVAASESKHASTPPNNTPTRTADGKMTDAATVYWWIRNNAPPAAEAIAAIQSVLDHAVREVLRGETDLSDGEIECLLEDTQDVG